MMKEDCARDETEMDKRDGETLGEPSLMTGSVTSNSLYFLPLVVRFRTQLPLPPRNLSRHDCPVLSPDCNE